MKEVLNSIKEVDKVVEDWDIMFRKKFDTMFNEVEVVNTNLRAYMCRGYNKADTNEQDQQEQTENPMGKIRVGRILRWKKTGSKIFPITDGYKNIVVTSHNKTDLGSTLSPYKLKDYKGRLMENIWQFAKIYRVVDEQRQKLWTYDEEVHVLQYEKLGRLEISRITDEYWKWRKKGMKYKLPIRYPNGFNGKENCICHLWPKSGNMEDIDDAYVEMEQLDYITARKRIYAPLYIKLAKQMPEFEELQDMLRSGQNIQILDVDGPDETIYEDPPYPYDTMPKGIHGVTSGVGSIEITKSNIYAMLNDVTQPFGHGYCLAVALLGEESWLK